METVKATARSLMEFLDQSPVNFLAVKTVSRRVLTRPVSQSSILAMPGSLSRGANTISPKIQALFSPLSRPPRARPSASVSSPAHSDSPCLRIKPKAEMLSEGGVVTLNVEVYGGPILYTWFDRPLSMAGRVMLRTDDPLHPRTEILKFDRPLLTSTTSGYPFQPRRQRGQSSLEAEGYASGHSHRQGCGREGQSAAPHCGRCSRLSHGGHN